MLLLAKTLILLIIAGYALLLLRTTQLQWTNNQSIFSGTVAPTTLPDGLYAGTVNGPQGSWLGKIFIAAEHRGINNFMDAGKTVQKYPFTLSIGEGVHDRKNVIQVDYDLPENPFWLRPCLDELVELSPGEYLGKLNIRIFPGYPFTLTYFRLHQRT